MSEKGTPVHETHASAPVTSTATSSPQAEKPKKHISLLKPEQKTALKDFVVSSILRSHKSVVDDVPILTR